MSGNTAAELTAGALQEAKDGLFTAAENGRADVIKALIEYGGQQLNLRQLVDHPTNQTPLHTAVIHGKTDAVRALLAANFPPDIKATGSSNGLDKTKAQSAYQLAEKLGNADVVRVFHQFLIQQVAANDVDGVRRLLDAGLEVDMNDGVPLKNTLLHWAASCGAVQVLELLLTHAKALKMDTGTLVNALNNDGATPLHDACHGRHVECVRLLLKHGAETTIRGKTGFSADRTPQQVTNDDSILRLFDRKERSASTESMATESTKMNGSRHGSLADLSNSTSPHDHTIACEQDVSLLKRQLEEKDGLIAQLKHTIESLATELEENQKVGEEKLVLEYIRKLRKEKEVLAERLDEAEHFIQMQQEQHLQLKRQIRFLTAQVEAMQTASFCKKASPRITSRAAPQLNEQPNTLSNRRIKALEETSDMEKEDLQQIKNHRQESTMRYIQSASYPHIRKARMEALELHSPGFWEDIKDMIWPVEEQEPAQKRVVDLDDEEVVMTV